MLDHFVLTFARTSFFDDSNEKAGVTFELNGEKIEKSWKKTGDWVTDEFFLRYQKNPIFYLKKYDF